MITEKLLGQKLGPYQIESILGSGGMATVYRARGAQGEAVALKILFPPPGAGPEILSRFEREARTAARLHHPAIVRVLAADQTEDCAFLAMTLIEGQTLADQLSQVGRLDELTAADIAWQIADALDYAHRQGVVHRDVKPSNILLSQAGRVLLTDFGVALALDDPALTRTGHTVGTPAYMAPEQAAGDQPVDGRADLYSLGVVLYQMVTGRTPFRGTTPQVLYAHVYEPPPAPSTLAQVSRPMEAVILQALAKDVAQRFQTGAAMAQALTRLDDQTNLPDTAASLSVQPQPRSPVKPLTRRRFGLVMLIILLLALSILAVWQWPHRLPAASRETVAAFTPTSTPPPIFTPLPTPAPVSTPLVLATPSTTPLPFPGGSLLQGSGEGVFRLSTSGLLQHIYDWPTFLAFGFGEADIQTIDEAVLDSLPQGGELTRLLQGQDQPLDWVVNGQRWRIERWQATLAEQGYRGLPASPADPLLLAALPLTLDQAELPEGSLLKGSGDTVYRLFAGGMLRPFAAPELVSAYGYRPTDVVEVPDEVLFIYRGGPQLTPLLRADNGAVIFLIENGQRHPMPNGDALWELGYGVEDISPVPAEFLESFALVAEESPAAALPLATSVTMTPLPSLTATPSLSITATPCPQPITTTLALVVEGNANRAALGCPRAEAMTTTAAWQSFEHGLMLWRQDSKLIYVLGPAGPWFSTGDTWRDGDDPYDPAIAAPPGFYQPVRGFGVVWRERFNVREALGWATAEEEAFTAIIQEFTGGQVWQAVEDDTFVILLSEGDYQIIDRR